MASRTLRARVHAEMVGEITAAARAELAEAGAGGLSLRAVARRVDMVPSALYRYFDSRDHLLTALIVDAYDALAAEASRAEGEAGPDPWDRWVAIGGAVRDRAARHPQEWALVFGSPVPGYAGTEATTAAALRLHTVPFAVVVDAHRSGRLGTPPTGGGPGVDALAPTAALFDDVPLEVLAGAFGAWSHVLGCVSLERFGHFVGAADDIDAYWGTVMAQSGALAGLGPV